MDSTINMIVHIVTGSIAVAAGLVALFGKKGAKLHRRCGNVFFVSMLIMAASGTLIAWLKPMMISVIAGVFTGYLVATSWMAVKTTKGTTTRFDYFAALVAFAVFVSGVVFGFAALNAESGLKDGFTAEPYFFFAVLGLIAFCLDIRMLICSGVTGKHRIARHLWRMCFALNIAVGSFLTQGEKMIPNAIMELPVVALFEDIILFVMFFYLAKVLFWSKVNNHLAQFKLKRISTNR